MKGRGLFYFGCLLILLLGIGRWSIAGTQGLQDTRIIIRDTPVVNSTKLNLVDIADIKASPRVKEQLETICLGYSPRLGKVKNFNGKRLEARVRSEINLPGNPVILVPETVLIKRASQEISKETLQEIFNSFLKEKLGQKEFRIGKFSLRGPDCFPEGHLSMEISSNSDDFKGRVTLYIDVSVDDEARGRISVSGWIDVFDAVLCAKGNLEKGTVLSKKDIRFERINISKISDHYFNSEEPVLGKALRNGVREGTYIRENMLEEPSLVKKGDIVTLIASAGNVRIVTIGVAREEGKMNDQIRVSSMNSNEIIHGVVTGPTRVAVIY